MGLNKGNPEDRPSRYSSRGSMKASRCILTSPERTDMLEDLGVGGREKLKKGAVHQEVEWGLLEEEDGSFG